MSGSIYVIGHKHSDLDSVASAYGYACLLQLQGEAQPIAARQGVLKPEVRFALERFHVDPPQDLEDVRGILKRQGDTLDVGAVAQLLRETEQALDRRDLVELLERLRREG